MNAATILKSKGRGVVTATRNKSLLLMLWLWPNEEASTTKQIGQPAKL